MKKFYVKKGAFEEVDLPMTRRHTRAGVEYSAAAAEISDKTRRSNSVDEKHHAARVITETDLTSSSLYKHRKAQMDSIDDEESNITGSRAQLIDRATQDSLRRDSESSMPAFLPYSVMAKKVQRQQDSRSCCCHALIAIGLIIAVGCIGMGIGGVVYMELYAAKWSNKSSNLESFVTEKPYGFGDLFEFGNITRIVLGEYFVPGMDIKANDFQDNANSQIRSNDEQSGLNVLEENRIAYSLDDVSKNMEDPTQDKKIEHDDVDSKISSDTILHKTNDITNENGVDINESSSDASVLTVNDGDLLVDNSQDKFDGAVSTTSFDVEEKVIINHDDINAFNNFKAEDQVFRKQENQGHDGNSDASNADKSLIEIGGSETFSRSDEDTQTFKNGEEDSNLMSFQEPAVKGSHKSVLLGRTTERIEHQVVTQQTTSHPAHGADERNQWTMSGNHVDEEVLETVLDEDKVQPSEHNSLLEKDNVSSSVTADSLVTPDVPASSIMSEVKSRVSSETTTELTNSDQFHSASVTSLENIFPAELLFHKHDNEKDDNRQLVNNDPTESDGLSTIKGAEQINHVTNEDFAHEKPTVNKDQIENRLEDDAQVTKFQNDHFTTDNKFQVQHEMVTVRNGFLENNSHDEENVVITKISTRLNTGVEPTEHFSTTETQRLSNGRLRVDLDKMTVPEDSEADLSMGHTEQISTKTVTNLKNSDRLRFDLDKSIIAVDSKPDDSTIGRTEQFSTAATTNLSSGERLRFDLDKSTVTEESQPTKSSVPEKITPFEFLRSLEMDQKLSELPPLSVKDMNMKFTLTEALEYLRSLDSKNKLPDSPQQTPHKRVTRSQSKEDLEFERKIYLNHLRKKLYDNEDD